MKTKQLKAFTLAEVLITLGIIGVVAAITIPILVNGQQKQKELTALKKAYTIFNQALLQMADDKGGGGLYQTGLMTTNATAFGDALTPYFKTSTICRTTTDHGCFSTSVGNNYDGSDPTRVTTYDNGGYRFVTIDGMSIRIRGLLTNTNYSCWVVAPQTLCGYALIDVNGQNTGPNNVGKDIFNFYITDTNNNPMLYPVGGNLDSTIGYWNDQTPAGCSSGNPIGNFCAGRIIEESWQINYY